MSNKELFSELRRDIVSGDWVLIATGRAGRPHDFMQGKRTPLTQPKAGCPFESLHEQVIVTYQLQGGNSKKDWWVEVVPNKYPAVSKGDISFSQQRGPYQWAEGVGFHEVVATRDHNRSLALMKDEEAELVIRAFQDRYLELKKNHLIQYISIIHNQGQLAGATIIHPHSQIIAIPVVPPDIQRSLSGSAHYFRSYKKCVHCLIINYEKEAGERVIYENENFLVIAPFASRTAFEMRVFPKKHSAHFEEMDFKSRLLCASALRVSLAKLFSGLNNPDYNFFLHTAPVKNSGIYNHYHWHIEIIPKTAIRAGFEIGTGIEISTIAPESAAEFLKGVRV